MSKVLLSLCLFFAALAMLAGTANAEDSKPAPPPDYRAKMQAEDKKACEGFRSRIDRALTPAAREAAINGAQMYCTCVPAETDRLIATEKTPISAEAMWNTFEQAYYICGGRETRAAIGARCASDPATVDRFVDPAAYCGCVNANISRLDDIKLHTEAEQVYEEAVAQANKDGTPRPSSKYAVAIRHFGAGCDAVAK